MMSGEKSDIRNPKSAIRNPKSEIRNPKSQIASFPDQRDLGHFVEVGLTAFEEIEGEC
jgi:hypothetical protein